MEEIKKSAFTDDDTFFKSIRITEGGNLVKAMTHKYIKRELRGNKWIYWYRMPDGKLVSSKKEPEEKHLPRVGDRVSLQVEEGITEKGTITKHNKNGTVAVKWDDDSKSKEVRVSDLEFAEKATKESEKKINEKDKLIGQKKEDDIAKEYLNRFQIETYNKIKEQYGKNKIYKVENLIEGKKEIEIYGKSGAPEDKIKTIKIDKDGKVL